MLILNVQDVQFTLEKPEGADAKPPYVHPYPFTHSLSYLTPSQCSLKIKTDPTRPPNLRIQTRKKQHPNQIRIAKSRLHSAPNSSKRRPHPQRQRRKRLPRNPHLQNRHKHNPRLARKRQTHNRSRHRRRPRRELKTLAPARDRYNGLLQLRVRRVHVDAILREAADDVEYDQ